VAKTLSPEEQDFINQVSGLLEPWGLVGSPVRVYAYLLLKEGPVSLNQIAADLLISKVGAWKSARSLEEFGHIRRYGEPGSKRALYGPTDSFEVPYVRQCQLLGDLSGLLDSTASTIAKGSAASRLSDMSQFYSSMRQTMKTAIAKLEAGRSARKRQRP